MKLWLFRLSIMFALVASLVSIPALSVQASSGACSISPSSGTAGDYFVVTADGFTPNAWLWKYAVEPDGTAFSDPYQQAFGGTVKADSDGKVAFVFETAFNQFGLVDIARGLGKWTIVIQELAPGGAILRQVECSLTLHGPDAPLGGAWLAVSPAAGYPDTAFLITGSGFDPLEYVNLWLSPPVNCSGFGYELDLTEYFGVSASAISHDTVKADADGNIASTFYASTPYTCTGEWSVSARALGSGHGAIAHFSVVGYPAPDATLWLDVSPDMVYAWADTLAVSGSGFDPFENVNCWYTRPEGTVRELPEQKADGSGNLGFAFTTGYDTGDYNYSEGSLGMYYMTCKGEASGEAGIASFWLVGLATDP